VLFSKITYLEKNVIPSLLKKKLSKLEECKTRILKNLASFLDSLDEQERKVFTDRHSVIKLLNSPVLKLLAIHKPKQFVNLRFPESRDSYAAQGDSTIVLD
jgi:hypothetical protein